MFYQFVAVDADQAVTRRPHAYVAAQVTRKALVGLEVVVGLGHALALTGIVVVVVVLGAVVREIGSDVAGAVTIYGTKAECRTFWEASCAGVCI